MRVKLIVACGVAGTAFDVGSVVEVNDRDGKYLIAAKRAEKTEAALKKIKPKVKDVAPKSDSDCAKELKKVQQQLVQANDSLAVANEEISELKTALEASVITTAEKQ